MSPAAQQQSEAAASLASLGAATLGAGPGGSRRRPAEDEGEPTASKAARARLNWSPELHGRFLAAVQHLGVNTAVPKTILQVRARFGRLHAPQLLQIRPIAYRLRFSPAAWPQLMNVDGMTRENVASHLQKYRLALRKAAGVPADQPLPEDAIARFSAAAPLPAEADPASAAATTAAAAPALPPLPPQRHEGNAAAAMAPPARPGAPHHPQPPQRRTSNHGLTSQELSSIATSASYESMFAPGAGTRPPPPAVLQSFIMGHADSFSAERAPSRPTANNPPKPEHEEAADAT